MNTISTYSNFRKDLLHLYCSTKSKVIEIEFLKFAQKQSYDFARWLIASKTIRKKLIDPLVYDALIKLTKMRNKYPDIKKANLRSIIVNDTEFATVVPIFLALVPLLEAGQFNDILLPFRDIILEIGRIVSLLVGSSLDSSDVGIDLKTLEVAYLNDTERKYRNPANKKLPLYRQRELMFTSLLRSFSEELASASQSAGFEELANYFKSGILAKPIPLGLGQYVEFSEISNSQMVMANKMVEYAWKYSDPKYQTYIHDFIEVTLLNTAGAISNEDMVTIKQRFEQEKDISTLYMGDNSNNDQNNDLYPGIDDNGVINMDHRLNPDFIYLLSTFFVMFQVKMKIPNPFID